jgi:hypothetical protein
MEMWTEVRRRVLTDDPDPSKTCVASPYAVELRWLPGNLKIICVDFVFYGNKIAFLPLAAPMTQHKSRTSPGTTRAT